MKLFRQENPESNFSRFRAKQLLLELSKGELSNERKIQVEQWLSQCKETEIEWQAITKALNFCEDRKEEVLSKNFSIQEEQKKQKAPYFYILALVFGLCLLSSSAYWVFKNYDFNSSNFQLLAKSKKVRPHFEALQIEVENADQAKLAELLNQFKKEGTEVKSVPGTLSNERTWSLFVLQSHTQQLIEQIKTLGLVRIPEGDSAELVSDGQIQIILKSKSI